MSADPRVLVVELRLPPKACSPNRRGHWAAHSGGYAKYRSDCALLIRKARNLAGLPTFGRAVVSYEFFLARRPHPPIPDGLYRPRDNDNAIACMKAFQDALVDAGLLAGDTGRRVSVGNVVLRSKKKDHGGRCCVVATITEVVTP